MGCDSTCADVKPKSACEQADSRWNMCTAGSSWWVSQCRRSCRACESGMPPCQDVTGGQAAECDPSCVNVKTAEACESANSQWGMCKNGGQWWKAQCKRTCQACENGLPPCSDVVSLVASDKGSVSGQNVRKHNFLAAQAAALIQKAMTSGNAEGALPDGASAPTGLEEL